MNNEEAFPESDEQIKKQKNINKIEVKEKIATDKKVKRRAVLLLKIFAIIFMILICAIALFVIFIFKKETKVKGEIKEEN